MLTSLALDHAPRGGMRVGTTASQRSRFFVESLKHIKRFAALTPLFNSGEYGELKWEPV